MNSKMLFGAVLTILLSFSYCRLITSSSNEELNFNVPKEGNVLETRDVMELDERTMNSALGYFEGTERRIPRFPFNCKYTCICGPPHFPRPVCLKDRYQCCKKCEKQWEQCIYRKYRFSYYHCYQKALKCLCKCDDCHPCDQRS